ncbi:MULTISPECIES: HlyD family secretion protein [unclassified Mesorhizobium]|uniref:HlyD family secretion protein n=1 Tax=unclassified Mesorhizobium TaxID=325217 RepID=UPI000FD76A05|nr:MULTISPECIES: HlyD family secretion protein [unclassified Mesorhizobium]TGR37042.1 HlyD family secretion protein [bacterium M00.F.Ca.ET.199.01.1.1]TGU18189.1 HlyD family secretion protein [bacterium M00.F.Ca.ET.156.01.1.1]TGV57691.1 HlyD family secretion protein [bacterium M00.F.Ca.ET.141.01.1.1]TGV82224.1 HlyD family secretion protein [Mesorhizobium sp. M00.F.Ca.ET.149.01.1.1]RWF42911.1 MAG: HlyD family secretion protein [Mesorhizobium sp.]
MNKVLSAAELQPVQPSTVEIPAPARKRRKPLLVLGALVAVSVAGWYGLQWWQAGRFLVSTDDAYVGGNVTPLAPRVAGHIDEILVEDNQHVTAGQLVIRIDDRPFMAALDRARAAVQQQQSALDNLRAQVSLQNSLIEQAQADLEAKNVAAVFTAQDAKRYEALASTKAGTQQDAQRSLAADGQARASVTASRAGLAAATQRLDVLNTQISEATAALAAARADVDTAQLDLGFTEVRSPIDGIVGNRLAQVGTYVSPGSYLLTIVPASGLWVDANFKEDQLRDMTDGQAATVYTDIAPDAPLKGHVTSLGPATGAIFSVIPPQNATGNFTKIVQRVPVRIAIDQDQAQKVALRPGLSTTVMVDTGAH